MKRWHLPSGLQQGLPFILPKDWTPEQAVAVVELLDDDDLRNVIYRHYHPQILEFMRQYRSTKFDSCVDKYGEREPF